MRIHSAACLLCVGLVSPVASFVVPQKASASSGLKSSPDEQIAMAFDQLGNDMQAREEETIELLESLNDATQRMSAPFYAEPAPMPEPPVLDPNMMSPPGELAMPPNAQGGEAFSVAPEAASEIFENYSYAANARRPEALSSRDMTMPREPMGPSSMAGQAFSESPYVAKNTPTNGVSNFSYATNSRRPPDLSSYEMDMQREQMGNPIGPNRLAGHAFSVSAQFAKSMPMNGVDNYSYARNSRRPPNLTSYDMSLPREPVGSLDGPNRLGGQGYSVSPHFAKNSPMNGVPNYSYAANSRRSPDHTSCDASIPRGALEGSNLSGQAYSESPKEVGKAFPMYGVDNFSYATNSRRPEDWVN